MRYVLGADGGGSKLACLVANESGELLGYGRRGGVNTNYVSVPQVVESVRHAMGAALQQAELRGDNIDALSISAPLGPEIVDFIGKEFGIRNIIRAAEGITPLWAARFWTEGRIGVTIDGGTGSLSRGWAEDGRETGAGGWGVALGDEGSGYWIGMKAMRAVMQAYDGRLEKTLLTQPILEHIGISRPDELPSRVHAGIEPTEETASERTIFVMDSGTVMGAPPSEGAEHSEKPESSEGGLFYRTVNPQKPLLRHEVASLAPVVVKVARQGDRTALEIMAEAGHELGRLGTAVIERLDMGKDEFVVVPFGGIFRSGDLVLRSFTNTIHAAAPHARVFISKFEPEVGAVLIALDNIGVVIDDRVIEAIERSSSDFPSCRAS